MTASPLAGLLVLQRLDTGADQLRHRRRHLPERKQLGAAETTLVDLDRRREALDRRRGELDRSQRRVEDEIAGLEAKRKEVDRRMQVVTVPRDAQALAAESDSLARHQSTLEDQVLEIMELAEPVDAELDRVAADREPVERDAMTARAAIAEAEVVVDAELATNAEQRTEVVAALPADLVAEYERLRARLDGVAVSQLDGHRCTGCHLTLSAVEVERIRHEPPDLRVYCEECGRLIVR